MLDPQRQDSVLLVRSPGPSAVIVIQGKAQRRTERIFIESGEGKLRENPALGPPLQERAKVPSLQTSPIETLCSLQMAALSVIVCSHLFPKANARLVRTLIYISLGGVRPGVKEQSCSIPGSRVFRAGLSHKSPATTSVALAPLPESEPSLQCQGQHGALGPCFCPFSEQTRKLGIIISILCEMKSRPREVK